MAENEIRVLTPTGCLGNGATSSESYYRGLQYEPHVVAVDAGSFDPGPYYLGSGQPHVARFQAKRDLRMLLTSTLSRNIPLIIGSAGGNGARPHLEWNRELILEVAQEEDLDFTMAVIWSDIPRDMLIRRLRAGKVRPLDWDRELSEEDVMRSSEIVALMGVEPLIKALDSEAQVILAGRSCDDALIAAMPVREGFDKGLALHMGVIMECGAMVGEWKPEHEYEGPTHIHSIVGVLSQDSFRVIAAHPNMQLTVDSVCGHSLYERSHPYRIPEPGGILDLERTSFLEIDDQTVEVRGSRFLPDPSGYSVKLEGAKLIGHRSFFLAGIRDPILIVHIDEMIHSARRAIISSLQEQGIDCQLNVRVYGKDGCLGPWEPQTAVTGHEIALLVHVVAQSQSLADEICEFARAMLSFQTYEGQLAAGGNLASPFSPRTVSGGPVYEVSVFHTMELEDPCEVFSMELERIRSGNSYRLERSSAR